MSGREGYAVLGIPVVHDPNDGFANASTLKRGHKCCGGCCDMRRAVVIVNIISVCLGAIGLPLVVFGYKVMNTSSEQLVDAMDDDEAKQQFTDAEKTLGASMGLIVFLGISKLICGSVGIYGAITYKVWAVAISLAFYCVEFAHNLFAMNIIGLLMPGFFAYPHVFFMKEVKEGIMSEENYELEKQSCCCV